MIFRKILLAAGSLMVLTAGSLSAQTATLSPYSRFGPGDMIFTGYAHQQAMGGTSIADIGVGRLNFANPSSYAYDTLMVFEFGMQAEGGSFKQGDVKTKKNNANLSYISFGLPLKKDKWGLSFGMIPYSATGYLIGTADVLDSNGVYKSEFEGSGGYNRYFLGTGFKIGKHLAVGGNFSYLFGTVNTSSSIDFNNVTFFDTRYTKENRISDLYYEFGVSWQQPIKKDKLLSLGLTGSPAVKVNTYSSVNWYNYTSNSLGVETIRDTVVSIQDKKSTTTLPAYLGFGACYSSGRKWAVLFDATYQEWSSYESPTSTDSLANSWRISGGARLTPDYKSLTYFNRVTYRAGAYYNRTFLDVRSTQLNDIGVTAGIGFPLRKSYQSLINFTFQAGQRGTLDNNLLRERYFRIQLGVTINEDWFVKKRYD